MWNVSFKHIILFNPELYGHPNQYLFQYKGNTKIISFITHYSSIPTSNLSGHFSTIVFYTILELTLMEKEDRRKKEVYEDPSDLVYKTSDVRENQEPPLEVTASSKIGGFRTA